jgi:hypothetical protein
MVKTMNDEPIDQCPSEQADLERYEQYLRDREDYEEYLEQCRQLALDDELVDEEPDDYRGRYEDLMLELCDVLEGGDVKLDFEDHPRLMGVIGCIFTLVKHELEAIASWKEFETMMEGLRPMIDEGLRHEGEE